MGPVLKVTENGSWVDGSFTDLTEWMLPLMRLLDLGCVGFLLLNFSDGSLTVFGDRYPNVY